MHRKVITHANSIACSDPCTESGTLARLGVKLGWEKIDEVGFAGFAFNLWFVDVHLILTRRTE